MAGRGTRFLPATKASPKEMLPIVDKPLIQYAAEEALAAGARKLVFITGSSKRAIEDHFDTRSRAGTGARSAGQNRPAESAEGHRAVVGELHLHSAAVAARSRSRGVVRQAGRRRRAVLRASRGRPDRRADAVPASDGERVRGARRQRARRRDRAALRDRQVRHRRDRRARRARQSREADRRKTAAAERAFDARGRRPLPAVADDLRRSWRRPDAARAARSS